jgi:hypothetical protein
MRSLKPRRVLVLDLVTHAPVKALFHRVMMANMAGVMPQVTAVWTEELGHEVIYVPFVGQRDLLSDLAEHEFDVILISAFTQSALLATAVSTWARSRGAVTVLGGPHARCFPTDAARWFDWVLGFTDKETLRTAIEAGPRRPLGEYLTAEAQPRELPTLRERWRFQERLFQRGRGITVVPMIASLGCPYTCSFCIDAVVPYQPLALDPLKDDLRFLRSRRPDALVSFYDPNFGVRFDSTMGALEEVCSDGVPVRFIAESSLSILRKERLERMGRAGFVAALPGIETWNDLGNKTGHARTGMEKVREVATHLNDVLEHVPYVQANFVLGLDIDEGDEPFELTKRFVDLAPGVFPGYSLLTAFGVGAAQNDVYRDQGRIVPVPFHFLNNNLSMNVRPLNYDWISFYDRVIDLVRYTFAPRQIVRRARGTKFFTTKWINALRALSSEGMGRLAHHRSVRQALIDDRQMRDFYEGETSRVPDRMAARVQRDLGRFWDLLPPEALSPVDEVRPGTRPVTAAV